MYHLDLVNSWQRLSNLIGGIVIIRSGLAYQIVLDNHRGKIVNFGA